MVLNSYISSKDRFIRFGYDWFQKFNTKIIIVNNETLSPNEELVQDTISILHVFSYRLYGLRKYKNQIKRMRKLLKSFKTEINPTQEQIRQINKTIGTCRFIYNFYLAHNKEIYETEKKFVSGMDFQKWVNNVYLKENPEYSWIKEVSSKSVKQSIMNAEKAFKRFFKHQGGFPRFKKKGKSDVKMYFVKTDAKSMIHCERHRIKIPTLGWVKLKEKGYIPTSK